MPAVGSLLLLPHPLGSEQARLLGDGSPRAQLPFSMESGTLCLCSVCASGLLLTMSNNLVLLPSNSSGRALLLGRDCGERAGVKASMESGLPCFLGLCPYLENPTFPGLDSLF